MTVHLIESQEPSSPTLPKLSESSDSSDLPEGWTAARLRDGVVMDVQTGFASGVHNRGGDGVAHLRPMNVNREGRIDLSDVKYVSKDQVDRDERWLHHGDVVFNNTNSPELVGKTAVYDLVDARAFSNHMTRIRCHPEALDPHYCALTLHHLWHEGYFEAVCNNHVSQASVSRAVLLDTEIPLPPLAEQKRIVEKVEALLAQVNASRERLARVPAILKRFRQAVLAAATSGRLTTDWRESHDHLVDGTSLVHRVRADRRAAWEAEQGADSGQTGTRSRRAYREPERPDTEDLPDLPEQWDWVTIEEIATLVTDGDHNPPKRVPEGIPHLTAKNVKRWKLTQDGCSYITPKDFEHTRTRYEPKEGDLIVTCVGTVGATAIVPEAFRFNADRNLAAIRPVSGALRAEVLQYVLNTPRWQDLLANASGASAQPHLYLGDLRALVVPIMPLEEQHEIVRRVDALFKLADLIEQRVGLGTARADRLTQAVLAKAFRGDLVPTEADFARREDRDYEPASALPARIRRRRAANSATALTQVSR